VGLGGYVASRLPQSSAGQSADAAGPTSTSTVHSMNAPQLPPTGSDLTFNATFAGSNLDTSVWDTCYWYGLPGEGCGHFGAYAKDEWYLPSQDQVFDGALHLAASHRRPRGQTHRDNPRPFSADWAW
jgi:hypothetical protein